MDSENKTLRNCITVNDDNKMTELLNLGFDPNFEGGWPIRLAARHGSLNVVRTLIQFGANPHYVSESGASTLQLAVYSGKHWDGEEWNFLLSYCDSSQLADAAAVAIVFKNISAFKRILGTGRCNTNLPTTLTGKTVEQLAKGYKLQNLLDAPTLNIPQRPHSETPTQSPRQRQIRRETRSLTPQPHHSHRNLSPSVARFFHQTSSLSPPATAASSSAGAHFNWAVKR